MIHAGDETTGFHQGNEPFEFGTHGWLTSGHGHFVEMPDKEKLRELLSEFQTIHARLTFEW